MKKAIECSELLPPSAGEGGKKLTTNNLINGATRLILAVFEEDHVARDDHVPRRTRCSSTNSIVQFASHDFAV